MAKPSKRTSRRSAGSDIPPMPVYTPPEAPAPEPRKRRGGMLLWGLVGVIVAVAAVEFALTRRKPVKVVPTKMTVLFEFGSKGKDKGQLDNPQDIAAGADGSLFVVDRFNTRIQKFNGKGEFVLSWGGKGQGSGLFSEPFSITVDSAGKVWVLDGPANLLQRFEADGTFLTQFMGDFYAPASVASDSQGDLYVANAGGANIRKYSSAGERKGTLAEHGTEKGQVADPNSVVVDPEGNLYVADTGNRRVQKLTSTGKFLKQWALPKETGGMIRRLLLHPKGHVYATDEANHCLWLFDRDLQLLAKVDGLASVQGERKLESPYGIAGDKDGNVYITDISQTRIFKCKPAEPSGR